ncbi:Divergent AAA domain protein [Limihaloglobus sulfuriphilus]|uniref:Divergent AAA domain protein n=1 Tax=Limihaloglobus sulfuriphilus TaxID=1851148 RepID=A0A1Q2MFY3_9BACT|nr:RNA-binding domain-containing protein [Limihaloglobus sulfuriphilus]AQQ71172.1 Divergent AAA domain protein [Limihaloglobus sulfuriphilus]
MLTEQELKKELARLLSLPKETEWAEFKEAKTGYDFNKLGKYFSALSNEANLKNLHCGWLVFGVNDKRQIVGSQFRPERGKLDSLKHEVSQHTTNNISFIEIYELMMPEGRVIMFQVPAAPKGIPTAWKRYYSGRNGESLGGLNLQEILAIRSQNIQEDWSAKICEDATISDLSEGAIDKARSEYKKKNPGLSEEVDSWEDTTFLNKAKITIQGKVTNSAIILLGKSESEHFLSPSIAQMTWILKSESGIEKDYEHFRPPFLINVERLFNKIRNLTYRYLDNTSLFPTEITQYEPWVIREALHNCIAHQDYSKCGRINIVENPDELIFTNLGNFIPGDIETVIHQDAPQELYRNPFLAQAMVNLNMIDTIGSGIRKMYLTQKNRYFPLPDYDLTSHDKIVLKIQGKVLDENYTRILLKNTDIDLDTVILLDKIQKRKQIPKDCAKYLRRKGLIEGRYPNLYISSKIAAAAGKKAQYIKNRAFDDEHYKKLIIKYIRRYGSATRKDIDILILDKLSDALSLDQKKDKIKNIIYGMHKRDGTIVNKEKPPKSKWVLSEKELD